MDLLDSDYSKNSNAGFTLLELMIAAGITAVALVLMFGSLFSISSLSQANDDRLVANAQLESVLEELHNQPLDELLAYIPPTVEGLGQVQPIEVTIVASDGQEVSLPTSLDALAQAPPNPVEVRVTLAWRDAAGRPQSTHASTFVRR